MKKICCVPCPGGHQPLTCFADLLNLLLVSFVVTKPFPHNYHHATFVVNVFNLKGVWGEFKLKFTQFCSSWLHLCPFSMCFYILHLLILHFTLEMGTTGKQTEQADWQCHDPDHFGCVLKGTCFQNLSSLSTWFLFIYLIYRIPFWDSSLASPDRNFMVHSCLYCKFRNLLLMASKDS